MYWLRYLTIVVVADWLLLRWRLLTRMMLHHSMSLCLQRYCSFECSSMRSCLHILDDDPYALTISIFLIFFLTSLNECKNSLQLFHYIFAKYAMCLTRGICKIALNSPSFSLSYATVALHS